ncbi:MAG: glyceraldehyde-3-phosphate dehydrogenase [Thermoanaerobaculia bacterium]|nr:glyceraldehyde-3-phosphate dehydrogenase [Thermoanaerobaculia bacterium]
MNPPIPFAIHGFGRIGRALARAAVGDSELSLVAINDVAPLDQLARLLARDSVHGRFPVDVVVEDDALRVGDRRVTVFEEPDTARIPWQETSARVVVDCSGGAVGGGGERHLRPGGPERVLISALASGVDVTLCRGVNDSAFDAESHHVVSAASCTTNCLALILRVLQDTFGVRQALMNEVHSYTGNQNLVDGPHDDPRRARAAAVNVVPTFTAAPAAVESLLPALAGRLAGQAVRVPTPDVALLDVVATLERSATRREVEEAYIAAASGDLHGLLAVSDEPLVSTDYVGDRHSAVVDLPLIQLLPGRDDTAPMVRVVAWYDNEAGYCQRLAELVRTLAVRNGAQESETS